MIDYPCLNHEPRSEGAQVDMLVLHYTGMESPEAALDRLCDPAQKVSAHYMIDEDGSVFRLVPEERRAWHAGLACWRGDRDINDRSIGIELANPGHDLGYRPFPEEQMAAVERLAREILDRRAIPPERVLGHSDVAPARKCDPGELFDWARLARAGVGLWPPDFDTAAGRARARERAEGRPRTRERAEGRAREHAGERRFDPDATDPLIGEVQRGLARFGYEIQATGRLDEPARRVVAAFQRHFRPSRVDGLIDSETARRLEALLAMAG